MNLEQLIDYDQWANNKIFEVSQSSDYLKHDSRIKELLSHLLTAQAVWINRIKGRTLPNEIWPNLSTPEIEHLLKENPEKLKKLIPKEDVTVSYKNSKGKEFSNTVQEILIHLTIHGQHHRAQISQLLRNNGTPPPATDFIFFLRERQ